MWLIPSEGFRQHMTDLHLCSLMAGVQQDSAQQQPAGVASALQSAAAHVRRHASHPGAARASRGARAVAALQRALQCGRAAAHRGHDHRQVGSRGAASHAAMDHRYGFTCELAVSM